MTVANKAPRRASLERQLRASGTHNGRKGPRKRKHWHRWYKQIPSRKDKTIGGRN